MKSSIQSYLLVMALSATVSTVQAHSPSEHAKPAQKPDCAALQESTSTTEAITDPVALAIRQQCGSEDEHKQHEDSASGRADRVPLDKEDKAPSRHQH